MPYFRKSKNFVRSRPRLRRVFLRLIFAPYDGDLSPVPLGHGRRRRHSPSSNLKVPIDVESDRVPRTFFEWLVPVIGLTVTFHINAWRRRREEEEGGGGGRRRKEEEGGGGGGGRRRRRREEEEEEGGGGGGGRRRGRRRREEEEEEDEEEGWGGGEETI